MFSEPLKNNPQDPEEATEQKAADSLVYGNAEKGGREMKERTSSCLSSPLNLVNNRIK